MKKNFILFIALFFLSCTKSVQPKVDIIPLPNSMVLEDGCFVMSEEYNPTLEIVENEFGDEAYKLVVDKSGIKIIASSDSGLFYGQKTLEQLTSGGKVPFVTIVDEPRFKYRGVHLDVSRHFRDKEFVKKIILELARYKMNRLHLHLTDATGWRIEIDKYPKLTSETAFRTKADWKDWTSEKPSLFVSEEKGGFGGYYTKDDVREIVKFAAENMITVIPEIEMPGHSQEVFVAYPELGCSDVPYKSGDFCVGNEKTFEFVEGVLDEVIELFPSEYIHIGGDEAGKSDWKTCPKCLKRMKENNLAGVDELQSYMIKRVENYLNSKNRKLIGWDEIIDGGLAESATVMSWRGDEGGVKAAKQGNDVVMTPSRALYLDFYQADPTTQPEAIGGFVPLKTVYDYDPMPKELTAEEQKHILGAQGNLWCEYIPTAEHAEYMLFPRVLAVAEMTWTNQENRNWVDFKVRANAHIPLLRARGVNAFELSYDIQPFMSVDTVAKEIRLTLDAEKYPADIRYTLDGTMPNSESAVYQGDIIVKDSVKLVAAIFEKGTLVGKPLVRNYDYHKAIGKPVKYLSKLYGGYMAGGEDALVNGYKGTLTYLDGLWQGYTNSLECVIDMQTVQPLTRVSARFMELKGPGVYLPGEFEVLTSVDGENFTLQGVVKTETTDGLKEPIFKDYNVYFDADARYVKVKASEVNNKLFIFIDEIVVW